MSRWDRVWMGDQTQHLREGGGFSRDSRTGLPMRARQDPTPVSRALRIWNKHWAKFQGCLSGGGSESRSKWILAEGSEVSQGRRPPCPPAFSQGRSSTSLELAKAILVVDVGCQEDRSLVAMSMRTFTWLVESCLPIGSTTWSTRSPHSYLPHLHFDCRFLGFHKAQGD